MSAIRSSTLLGAVVADAAERFGDRPAFVASGDAWQLTYRDLQTMSDRVAGGLAALGVGPGSVVALVLPSTIDYPTGTSPPPSSAR